MEKSLDHSWGDKRKDLSKRREGSPLVTLPELDIRGIGLKIWKYCLHTKVFGRYHHKIHKMVNVFMVTRHT